MAEKLTQEQLRHKADFIRREIVRVCVPNGAGHIAPSLSCVDLLTALYYRVMSLDSSRLWPDRDRLIFSKAHGCYALYAILADIGYITKDDWDGFYKGSFLAGCVEQSVEHGLEAGCGSLGHGLPIAVGIAYGARFLGRPYRVYCIVGDGEMQEGSNWEAVQFAVKHRLTNLTILIDNNGLQAMDFLENVLTVQGRTDDLAIKLDAFGCLVEKVDGHSVEKVVQTLEEWRAGAAGLSRPQALVARTVKGYGLACMENVPKFHFRLPTQEELHRGSRRE